MKPCKNAPNKTDCSHPELIKIFNKRAEELHIEELVDHCYPCPFASVSFQEYLRPICKYYEPIE